jgi:glycosyltransferase involved in cell wall biosynthesis
VRTPVDILYVASGTTPGHRRSDEIMLAALARCGVSTGAVTASFTPPGRINDRIYGSTLATDVYESAGLAWATHQARARYAPRAIMYATTHALLYQPPATLRIPFAVRFDFLTQLSRLGRRFALEHLLERRRFRAARVLLPTALETDPAIGRLLPPGVPTVPLPLPIEHLGASDEREPTAVTYTGSPGKKGLEVIVGAWQRAATADRRLIITGITREAGLRYLAEHGLEEPADAEWPGLVSHAEFRKLTQSAEIYLSASTYEAYGIAQLEALSDGALLVTTPSPGPFAALPVARRLAPGLVSAAPSAEALADALTCALQMPDDQRREYRRQAAALVRGHSEEVLEERLRTQVLPALLEA